MEYARLMGWVAVLAVPKSENGTCPPEDGITHMQRTIEISFKGHESSFKLSRIERSKLYGGRRRIPVDASGRECVRVSLTLDGKFILPPGSTARLYLDESGEVVERDGLQTISPNGDIISHHNASAGIVETGAAVQVSELLDYAMIHAYALEPVFISPDLSAAHV
jgi:hypothetical protein